MLGLLIQHVFSYAYHAANAQQCLQKKLRRKTVLPSLPRPGMFLLCSPELLVDL